MKINEKIFLTVTIGAFFLSACAKQRAPLIEEKGWGEFPPQITEAVLIARMDFSPTDSSKQLTGKILGEFRDALEELKEIKKPVVIVVPPLLIRRLSYLQENGDYINERILKSPEEISESDREYLREKYELFKGTQSILNAQVKEGLSLLGNSLRDTTTGQYLIQKSTYSLSDKNTLLDFIRSETLSFESLLKKTLDKDYIREATTSLSDAYLGLLDDERIRTQIMEGIVSYKRWRGEFPEGFIPRSGFLNRTGAENIQRTGIRWVLVEPEGKIHYNTQPSVIDQAFMTDIYHSAHLLRSPEFKPVDAEKYISSRVSDKDEMIELSSAEFVKREWEMENPITRKLFSLLKETRDMITEYRDSGRARIDVLSKVRSNLLIAESGEIYDNIKKTVYDRIFRKSLIDIYRAIGAGAPAELFVPVGGVKSAKPESTIETELDIDFDGRISEEEWEGAYSSQFPESLEGLGEIYWGADKNNIYFAFEISSPTIETVGVYLGHEATPAASLTPRGKEYKIENIIDFPLYIESVWQKDSPSRTEIFRASGRENWEKLTNNYNVGYSGQVLEFAVPMRYLGAGPEDDVYLKFYVNDLLLPENEFYTMTLPHLRLSEAVLYYIDPAADAYGPGNYSFPEDYRNFQGNFDLRSIRINKGEGENIITVGFSDIILLQNPDEDFCNPVLDIYIDINNKRGAGRVDLLEGRNSYTTPEDAWEYVVTISPEDKAIYNTAGRKIGDPKININPLNRTLNIFISEDIIGASVENWGVIPAVLGGTPEGKIVRIKEENDSEKFIAGRRTESDTNIIDVILPSGYTQREILGANRRGGAVSIPALR